MGDASNMLLRNDKFQTFPIVVHSPFGKHHAWLEMKTRLDSEPYQEIGSINDLTILTWNNSYKQGILEISLDRLGIPYVVLGRDRDVPWRNLDKIPLLLEAMEQVDTQYVMAADCYDVIVLRDLHEAVERFANSGHEVLFNATCGRYGLVSTNKVESVLFSKREVQHLNSGAFIGKTEFCRQLYAIANDAIPVVQRVIELTGEVTFVNSDQAVLKAVLPMLYPRVRIDSRRNIFQILTDWEEEEMVTVLD